MSNDYQPTLVTFPLITEHYRVVSTLMDDFAIPGYAIEDYVRGMFQLLSYDRFNITDSEYHRIKDGLTTTLINSSLKSLTPIDKEIITKMMIDYYHQVMMLYDGGFVLTEPRWLEPYPGAGAEPYYITHAFYTLHNLYDIILIEVS